jgi:hypothetical protein
MRFLALVSLIILMGAADSWALGRREDPLVQADRLIADQKYDEAILYLSEFIKLYPDRFDQAQAKLRKITRIRTAYNEKALALLETMVKEPTNEEKKIAMIRELENFEKNPSPAVRDFIAKTKDLALFTYNRAMFEEIMEEGRFLIDSRRFAEAARTYQRGFELYRPEFIDEGYDPAFVSGIFGQEQAVIDAIAVSESLGSTMESAFAQLVATMESRDAIAFSPARTAAEAAAVALADQRRIIVSAGRTLEAAFAELAAADPKLTDSSYLPFAYRLILGRRTESELEGVAGTIDAQWTIAMGSAQNSLETLIRNAMDTADTAFAAREWLPAQESYAEASQWIAQSLPVLALWSLYGPQELDEYSTPLGQAVLASKGSDYLRLLHLAETAADQSALAALHLEMDTTAERLAVTGTGGLGPTGGLSELQAFRASFIQAAADIEVLRSASGDRAETLLGWSASGFAQESSLSIQGIHDGNLANTLDKARQYETTAVAKAASFELGLIATEAEAANRQLSMGRNYLEGIPSDDPTLPDAVFRFPSRSMAELAGAEAALVRIAADLQAYLAKYQSEPAYISAAAAVLEWLERGNTLRTATAAGLAESRTLAVRAREQKQLADSSRLEAERRIAEASAALRSNNFGTARERIERARERYLASLSFEQDPDLRRSSDTLLAEIAAAILKAENDLVVADTRRLLTDGRNFYLQGVFDRAESTLLQARARWSTTNVTPEVEVEYWLRLVQTALTVKTGRDIPSTAPLFPEMSQLLSLAQKYYDDGANLLNRGDKTSALRSFAQARQKISEVKVIFPLNQTARVLELRIDQLSDAGEFNRKFARLFEEARAKINAGEDLTTAYSDLKDLEAINSRYPGLQTLIAQAEIRLGFRQPPPDPRAIAEARSLTEAARRIFDSGDVARFSFARTQVERAILLDPNNTAASQLKDRIATYIGGDTTIVLNSSAETLYNEAVAFFTGGNYIGARARLTRLGDVFPQGRSVQKVADLNARLSALGY